MPENHHLIKNARSGAADGDPMLPVVRRYREAVDPFVALHAEWIRCLAPLEAHYAAYPYGESDRAVLERAKRGSTRLTVIYESESKWQELIFSALTIFSTDDGQVLLKGSEQ